MPQYVLFINIGLFFSLYELTHILRDFSFIYRILAGNWPGKGPFVYSTFLEYPSQTFSPSQSLLALKYHIKVILFDQATK